jgi:hypothetical protein
MNTSTPGTDSPPFDQALADSYIGKYILVGLTFVDHTGTERRRQQLHGVIERASRDGIVVSLRGAHQGRSWTMPPDLGAISQAEPGVYRLRTTGEQIENPDLLASWRIEEPQNH